MSKWLQHTIELIVVCVALIGVAVFYNTHQVSTGGHTTHHHLRTARQVASSDEVPTLYFHGLQGTARSTNHLIDTAARIDGQRAMIINVDRNGRLDCRGSIRKNMKHPLVQVNFLDNMAPVSRQVQWAHQILMLMKSKYHINKYNAIAHSAGAITVLETTDRYGTQKNVAHLSRFASIAGPYDGVIGMNDQPNQNTINRQGKPQIFYHSNRWYPGYEQLLRDSRHFPKGVKVLNIYGRIDRKVNADGYVTNVSARSLKYLLHGRDVSYEEVPIYGRYAEHSWLHHNSVVDRIVNRFIFNK